MKALTKRIKNWIMQIKLNMVANLWFADFNGLVFIASIVSNLLNKYYAWKEGRMKGMGGGGKEGERGGMEGEKGDISKNKNNKI